VQISELLRLKSVTARLLSPAANCPLSAVGHLPQQFASPALCAQADPQSPIGDAEAGEL
jgi:hypothetical protein